MPTATSSLGSIKCCFVSQNAPRHACQLVGQRNGRACLRCMRSDARVQPIAKAELGPVGVVAS